MPATLNPLLEQAEAARDAAMARVLRASEATRRLQLQAEQLAAYREDYRRRSPALGAQGASVELLRCHRDFMARLDQAIEQLRGQLAAAEREAETAREQLVERELRVASVRKLIERRLTDLQRAAARLEQRRSDEAAMRRAWPVRDAAPTEY